MSGEDETADLKIVHLNWLVDSRKKNQECTLALYKLMVEHGAEITIHDNLFYVSQSLSNACFSLWRAAFLSDISTDGAQAVESTKQFLRQIIASNMIGFNQDLSSSHYTFRFYTGVAQDQLNFIFKQHKNMHVVREAPNEHSGSDAMDYWDCLQDFLTTAVDNFGQYLRAKRDENK